LTPAGNHFSVFSTLVKTANTSSMGRSMMIEVLTREATKSVLLPDRTARPRLAVDA
jgi:hypothetical protein